MSQTPRPKPPRRTPSSSPSRSGSNSDGTNVSKPYKLITFPNEPPTPQRPAGHHKYHSDRLHGTLFLTLKVQTSLHVSTGVVAMGSDIGNNRIPLIKTMVQDAEQKLSIQGSSLKGCIRSVYEAITRSCICKTKADRNTIPDGYRECEINSKRNKLSICDACQIFGALNWQGLIDCSDASCDKLDYNTGFMPSLYAPQPKPQDKETKERFLNSYYFGKDRKIRGRKFYYQFNKAIDKGQNQGITVQQAAKEYTFTTQLQFRNLQPAELGTLLIVLGQDPKYPIALKVGGGKPIGMGTMTATVTEISAFADNQQRANEFKLPMLRQRYSSYTPTESDSLTGKNLQQFMEKTITSAHSTLIQKSQLQQLTEVLRYPTDREPPTGMY